MLFSSWLIEWLDTYKRGFVKPRTLQNIDICIRLHIPDFIKDSELASISPLQLQKALNSVNTSRNRISVFDIYSEAFRRAHQLGFISSNPMLLVDKAKHFRKLGSSLSASELLALFSSVSNPRLNSLFRFYLCSGLRRSEALSLKWSDLDFKNKLLHVHGTKTLLSNRSIPLFKDLELLLLSLPHNGELLFPLSPSYVSRRFHQFCPNHKLHDLRHTFATRCLECGISIRVVQHWLGHSRLDTTAGIYTHISDSFNQSEAVKFKLFDN